MKLLSENYIFYMRFRKGITYFFLIVLSIVTMLPLLFLLINAFKSQAEIIRNPLALPTSFDLRYHENGISGHTLWQSVDLYTDISCCFACWHYILFFAVCMDDCEKKITWYESAVLPFCCSYVDSVPGYYVSADQYLREGFSEKSCRINYPIHRFWNQYVCVYDDRLY